MSGSETKHYGEDYTLVFNPESKLKPYSLKGSGVPIKRVTTIIGKVIAKNLSFWAAKCAADLMRERLVAGQVLDEVEINKICYDATRAHVTIRDTAADAGSFVHDWLHNMVKDTTLDLPVNPAMREACESAKRWYDRHKIKVVQSETPLFSKSMLLAGTPDLICYIDGKLSIVDWKTGKGLYYDHLIQLGFYALMFEEEFGLKIEQFVLVNASIRSPFKTFTTNKVGGFKLQAKNVHKLYKSMAQFDSKLEKGDAYL